MDRDDAGSPCRLLLVVPCALWLAGLAGTGAAADRGLAGLPFNCPVVFTQLPAWSPRETTDCPEQAAPQAPCEGARLAYLPPGGPLRVLSGGFHSACDPGVSFDGTRLLFAGKRVANDDWNVFEVGIDGSGLRQITRGLGDCRRPCYQSLHYQISDRNEPWYQITFVGSDPSILDEQAAAPARSLWSCKLDGTLARRLTFNLSGDFDPTVTWDGRLLYASLRPVSSQRDTSGRVVLMDANNDGTDYAPFVVRAGKRIKHMPCSVGQRLAVFVETDRAPWDGAGQLAAVSLLRPLHTYRSLTEPSDGLFHSPSPLPDGNLLVSWRPASGRGTHAVCRFDLKTKRMQVAYDDPKYHDIQAKAVVPRQEPDGRSSSVLDHDPKGKLYCMSVYTTDPNDGGGFAPGTVKRVRVLEGIPRNRVAGPNQPRSPQPAPRRLLGEVEIPADGSFHLEVPPNTPLELQLIGECGMALRSCGWVWTRNHFSQGCVGCHEDPEVTPENRFVTALSGSSASLDASTDERAGIDFRRDVMPIVTAKCLPCHDQRGSPPRLGDRAPLDPHHVHQVLRTPQSPGSHPACGKYVHPGRARTSPLVWHLFGRNTSQPWDAESAGSPAKHIPAGATAPLTDSERRTFIRWIDLGAAFEDPAATGPPAGPAKTGPGGE